MKLFSVITLTLIFTFGCNSSSAQDKATQKEAAEQKTSENEKKKEEEMDLKTATFAGGCFWCTEAIFQALDGVDSVLPGYMGGKTENPTYKQVCTGATGHAEVIQIKFDPTVISFEELLFVFFKTHDPTTLNRQGNDGEHNIVALSSITMMHKKKPPNRSRRKSTTQTITQIRS